MAILKLDNTSLARWVNALIGQWSIHGVKAKGDRFAYGRLNDASELRLDFDVTIMPPKKYFLPEQETLLRFTTKGQYQSVAEAEPFTLFGVHPYDVIAIAQMDAIFAKDNRDVHYFHRREKATIVACDIQALSPNGFAASMGTATIDTGYDILLTKVGGNWLAEVRTKKGEELAKAIKGTQPADDVSLGRREQVWEDARRFVKVHQLRCKPEDLPALLEKSYDHPLWEKRAKMCYSCGSCNLVCPTCYCFDVQDDLDWNLTGGQRFRRWDGCMLSEFALVAGGHNFRKRREERYRHRYYRKGKYLWDRMNQIACVGCGRCITACTTQIANPVEVYNSLMEDRVS